MPTYCFVCKDCGTPVDVTADVSNRPSSVKCEKCGSHCRRNFQAEQGCMGTGDTWSRTGGFENARHETGSLSRAVHVDQVSEQRALDKQKGITGVEWKPDGRGLARPHFSSKRSRDNWDRAYGFASESHY